VLPSNDTLIALGLIQKPRGLHGELLVKLHQAASPNLQSGLAVVVKSAKQTIQTKIQYAKMANSRCWIKFEGIDDRTQAESIAGGELLCRRDLLAEPAEGEHFVFDLIGLTAVDIDQKQIGIVRDVINMPANDVLEIETPGGAMLVPFIKEFIKEIILEKRIIIIDKFRDLLPDEN
jgi:16S rRNA processing protein RimM